MLRPTIFSVRTPNLDINFIKYKSLLYNKFQTSNAELQAPGRIITGCLGENPQETNVLPTLESFNCFLTVPNLSSPLIAPITQIRRISKTFTI